MPARHSETSAGTSDDSETPGDRGPGRHISEGTETCQRINSGVKSSAVAEPDVLGASPKLEACPAVESRRTKAAELPGPEHMQSRCQGKQVQG